MWPERARTDDYPDLDVSYRHVRGTGVVRHIDGVPEPVIILTGSGNWTRDSELVGHAGRSPLNYPVEFGPDGTPRHDPSFVCEKCGSGPRAGSRTWCPRCQRYDPALEPILRAAGPNPDGTPDPRPQDLPASKPRRAVRQGRKRRRGRRSTKS